MAPGFKILTKIDKNVTAVFLFSGVDLSSEAVMAIEALFLLVNSETQTKQKSIQVLKVTYNSRSGFFKNL